VILIIALPTGAVGALAAIALLVVIAASLGAVVLRAVHPKKVLLDVDRQRLVIGEGRGGTFPLSSAALGPWRPSGDVISGSVLHLAHGAQTYRVGGLDYRPSAGIREGAPASENVDAFLSKEDFEALLAFAPLALAGPDRGALAVVRCPLHPNPSSDRRAFRRIASALGTLALVVLAAAGLDATGLFDSRAGQYVGVALIAPLVVGGIVLMIVLERRRGPELELELDLSELRLCDPKVGRVLAAAPRNAVDLTRGMHRAGADGADREYPMLAIRIPEWEELTLGVYDVRYGWRDDVPYLPAPHYRVGTPDWNTLVEALDIQSFVVARDGV
jgi:hypothetical protein